MGDVIWVVCAAAERTRERAGYFEALGVLGKELKFIGTAQDQHSFIQQLESANEPQVVVFPDPPLTKMPPWLPHERVISCCFQIDSFSKPNWRSLWSSLFDCVVLFHPYPPTSPYHLHPGAITLPHAVAAHLYSEERLDRPFDVGWVGSLKGPQNQSRQKVIPELANRFTMNDVLKYYSESEVPDVYLQSKIVVNVSRDDHPTDANTRCFEAMAAGAMLITQRPSELELLGFAEGIHFIGFRTVSEIPSIVRHFLLQEDQRASIADAGRHLVLGEHTYANRARRLITWLTRENAMVAPARSGMPRSRCFPYFHYVTKRVDFQSALVSAMPAIRSDPANSPRILALLARRTWHELIARVRPFP
jgi:hypothetical protein